MKLIVGLGNPGEKYKNTRHNAGYVAVDELLSRKIPKDVVVRKTNVFMNNSGRVVAALYTKYKILNTNLYVIHDDLDIRLGEYKIQFGIGPKDHKGILSIERHLKTKNFWRVRVGVDNRDPSNRIEGEEYVLQNFSKEEKEVLETTIKKLLTSIIKR